MPFRAAFDCLWCGRPHAVRGPADIEGFAQLCPDCLGKAGSNGFLRARLHAALTERAAAARGARQDDADAHRESGTGETGAAPRDHGSHRTAASREGADA